MDIESRFRSDGSSLRSRLFVLVLVPLLGVAGFAAAEVQSRLLTAHDVRGAEQHVITVGMLSTVRNRLLGEVVPAVARAVTLAPERSPGFRIAVSSLARLAVNAEDVAAQRLRTDRAVRELRANPSTAALAGSVVDAIGGFRRQMDATDGIAIGFQLVQNAVRLLTNAEQAEVAEAVHAGLTGAAARSIDDLERVTATAQYAELELPFLTAVLLPFPGRVTDAQRAWFGIYGNYRAALAGVLAHGSADAARQVRAVVTSGPGLNFDDAAATAAGHPADPRADVVELVRLYPSAVSRSAAFAGVVDAMVNRAIAAAAVESRAAMRGVWTIVAIIVVLLALSLLVGLMIRLSVTRPLAQLAQAAQRVSRGELEDVPIGGPREVRTAARALSGAVANLRGVAAKAAAVSSGDLDSDVLREPLPGPLGAVVHASMSTLVDAIHARDLAQIDLAHRATHDPLTELPNRSHAMAMIERALARAWRRRTSTGLMFVDLDYFKTVNDTFGHEAGDAVLRAVSRRMLDAIRARDTVARLGGDEFVILIDEVSCPADIARLAERLIATISDPIDVDRFQVRVGASIGVAFTEIADTNTKTNTEDDTEHDAGTDAGRLLREADAAAYQAKKAGRGRVGIFDDRLRDAINRRAEMEAAIGEALERSEFVLYYQPVVDVQSGRAVGVEALIRWQRPGHGLVSPADFIPVAEESPLIRDIGRWTLHEATAELARWQAASGRDDLTVAVNISGRHLTSTQVLTDVADAIRMAGIAADRVIVEITETVLVDDADVSGNLAALRWLGVRIAIDDFGTGYTSIGQLPKLPVDILKIDRSFVADTTPAGIELLRLIAGAAHAFDLEVIAEGIETVGQVEVIAGCGVRNGQGFYYARPVPAGTALELMQLDRLPSGEGMWALPRAS